jgi:hypothetical protein
MKCLMLLLLTIALAGGMAPAQGIPETPQPAEGSQSVSAADGGRGAFSLMWDRLGQLPRDQKIKVQLGNGRWERCMFSGTSQEYLYCAIEDRAGFVQEWEINRANIAGFKLDHDLRNGRIVFASGVMAAGIAIGIWAYQKTRNEEAGVYGGMLGAGTVGLLSGSIGSCVAGHCITLPTPPRPDFGIQYNVFLGRWKRLASR